LTEMWSTPTEGEDVQMLNFVLHAALHRATGDLNEQAPGLSCISPLIDANQVKEYINGSQCLSRRLRQCMGVGQPERMINDFIYSHHVLAELSVCTQEWGPSTRRALRECQEAIAADSSTPMAKLLTASKQAELYREDRMGDDVKVFYFVKKAELERLTGLVNGGATCLSRQGLAPTQLQQYANATLCLGAKIQQGVGPYASDRVVKDFLEGPDNYDSLYACLKSVGPSTKKAVRSCLRTMEQLGDPRPVVTFWWEST